MRYDFERLGEGLESLLFADAMRTRFTTDEDYLHLELKRRTTGQMAAGGLGLLGGGVSGGLGAIYCGVELVAAEAGAAISLGSVDVASTLSSAP